jgi:hypothetical protein
MRRLLTFAAFVTAIALPAVSRCQQVDPDQVKQSVHGSQGGQSVPDSSSAPDSQNQAIAVQGSPDATPAPAHVSVAAAARKAREQRKESSKEPKVFTNENLPTSGGISFVGGASNAGPGAVADTDGGTKSGGGGEKVWRERFDKLNHKLESDKEDLAVMERELSVLDMQYYSDPVKAMQQQYSRDDINKKTADIDAKKKTIEADQQAIDDAQDELRKSGGDPGWAR